MKEIIKKFILEDILEEKTELDFDTPLYSNSLLGSMGHLKLVNFLERNFNVSLPGNEIKMSNFNTMNQIALFIEQKKSMK